MVSYSQIQKTFFFLSIFMFLFSVTTMAQRKSRRGKVSKKKQQPITFSSSTNVLPSFSALQGWSSTAAPAQVADINGDNELDIVGFNEKGVFAAFGNGDGTFQKTKYILDHKGTNNLWTAGNPILLADVNKDNKADILILDKSGLHVTLSTIEKPISNTGSSNPVTKVQLSEIIGSSANIQKLKSLTSQSFVALFPTISTNSTMSRILTRKIQNTRINELSFKDWWMGNSVTESEVIVSDYFDKLIDDNPLSEEYKAYYSGGRQQLVLALDNRSLTVTMLKEMTNLTELYYKNALEEINGIADYTVLDNLKATTIPTSRPEFTNLLIDNTLNLMTAISGPMAPAFKSATVLKKIALTIKKYKAEDGNISEFNISGTMTNNEIKAVIRRYRAYYQESRDEDLKAIQQIRLVLLKDATLLSQFVAEHKKDTNFKSIFVNQSDKSNTEKAIKLKIRKSLLNIILPISGKLYGIKSYIDVSDGELLKGQMTIKRNVPRPKGAEDILAYSTYRGKSRFDKKGRRHNWYLALGGENNFGEGDGIPNLLNKENNQDIWNYIMEAYDNKPSEILKLIIDKDFPKTINGSNFYFQTHPNQIFENASRNTEDLTKMYMGYFKVPGRDRVLPSADANRTIMIAEPTYWFIYSDSKLSNKKLPIRTRLDFEVQIANNFGAGTNAKIGVKLKYNNGSRTAVSKMDLLRSDMVKGALENNYFFVDARIEDIEEIRIYNDGSGGGSELNIASIDVTVNKIKATPFFAPFSMTFKNPNNKGLEEGEMLVLKKNGTSYTEISNLSEKLQKKFEELK